MLERRKNLRSVCAAVSAVAAVLLFTACASTPNEGESTASSSESPSDAALLLDNSSVPQATEVSDAGAFSDLEPNREKPTAREPDPSAASVPTNEDSSSPFYNSIGGESLRRVAHTLYSDKGFVSKLLEKNPDLKGVKRLSAEQKVFFDMDSAKPEPTFLTKDLLDRYAGPLAERVTASVTEKGLSKTTATLNPGETLQELSKRLYGTHRYWTEIFLVNHDKIRNYDKVKSGMTLTVVDRPNAVAAAESVPVSVAAKTAPPPPPPPVMETTPEPTPSPSVVEAKPEPVVTPTPVATPVQPDPVMATQEPVPVAPADPIPETPVVAEAKPEPAPIPEAPKAVEPSASTAEISSSNAVTRPIIYAVLVLLILGGGFYYTRAPKKPKVDMLDITSAESAARPKLAAKDSQNKIG